MPAQFENLHHVVLSFSAYTLISSLEDIPQVPDDSPFFFWKTGLQWPQTSIVQKLKMIEVAPILISDSPGYSPQQTLDDDVLCELGNSSHEQQVISVYISICPS
jgi:hypothetical protein